MNAFSPENRGDRVAGICLIGAAAVTVFAMAHHPSSHHGAGGINAWVHGGMIVLLTAIFFGFSHFAVRRGLDRPLILSGLVAYAISAGAHIAAALINGFIAPAYAEVGESVHDILLLCWEANQALAALGVYATGTAFILWSVDFGWRPGKLNRIIGVVGVIVGVVPAVALLTGQFEMDVKTAFAVYTAHAVWIALVGVHLVRRI